MRLLRRNIHYVGKLVPTTEACCKWQSGVSPGEAGSNMQKRERRHTIHSSSSGGQHAIVANMPTTPSY